MKLGSVAWITLVGLLVAGCSAQAPAEASVTPRPTGASPGATAPPQSESATASRAPTPSASPTPRCPTEAEVQPEGAEVVSSKANIFGAGRDTPPAPAGGGAGELPPVWTLPPGTARSVTFPVVVGCVNPIVGMAGWNGPGGDGVGATDVDPFEGISGIVHERNGMFLVGVFLRDGAPSDPAPETLDFTDTEAFATLAPEIGQTFLVGDGNGRRYDIPDGATRLSLGFADGYLYKGPPGWYGNNAGELFVTVEIDEG